MNGFLLVSLTDTPGTILFATYCSSLSDLGQDFSVGLYQAEVDYLISREFAKSAEDIIWRRTRLGIRMNRDQITELRKYVDARMMSTKTVTGFRNANVYS